MSHRLCSYRKYGRHAWLATALCLCGYSCTPVSGPKQAGVGSAQDSADAAPQLVDAGPRASERTAADAEAQRSMPGINTKSQRGGTERSGGEPAQGGGSAETQKAGTVDAGVATPESDAKNPDTNTGADQDIDQGTDSDEEDESYVPRTDPVGEQETVIAPETSDTASLQRLSRWNLLPVFAAGKHREQSVQDRGTNNRDEIALFPTLADGNRDVSNFICRGTQGDVGSGTIAYLFDEGTCPEEYVRGVEMARFTGSGRMVRFWMTATTVAPGVQIRDEWLRIYVDDNPRPLIQLRVNDVLGGSADEIFATPFGSGARSLIAWHYPVVFSTKLVVALDHLGSDYFYEIDAVLDDVPQKRVAGGKRRAARDAAHSRLANPSPVPSSATQLVQEVIALGTNEQRHVELTGPATVYETTLRVPQDKLASLSGVRITGRWDDDDAPAIDLPLLSLFAAGHTLPNADSLALASRVEANEVVLSLRLPMPFASKAAWDVTNTGAAPADFTLTWTGEAGVPDEAYGRLNVRFQDSAIPLTQVQQSIAELTGRGRFVGLCADIVGRSESSVLGSTQSDPMDLARGDVRITTDGELALHSTATDHYANNALYFGDSPRGTPFAQTWGRTITESENRGQVSFCRWHVLGNEIDFSSSLSVTREAVQSDPSIIDLHRTVAYLYVE